MNNYDLLLGSLYRLRPSVQQLLSENSSLIFNLPDSRQIQSEKQGILFSALEEGIVRLRIRGKLAADRRYVDRPHAIASKGDLPLNAEVELTSKGAALWEKGASPSWDYFVEEGEPRVLQNCVWICFEAKSRVWLECVHQTLMRFGFFRENKSRILVRKNWHPVYWKHFDVGYSLRINTGHSSDTDTGKLYLQGIASVDNRLSESFSALANIWDARWVNHVVNPRGQV